MLRTLLTYFTLVCAAIGAAGQNISFLNAGRAPVAVEAAASTGLDGVYVLEHGQGADLTVRGTSGQLRVALFDSRGAAYTTYDRTAPAGATELTLRLDGSDTGVMVCDGPEGTKPRYWWLINYDHHRCELRGLSMAPEQECGRAVIELDGSAADITAYGINGRPFTISRELELTYNTLTFNAEAARYEPTPATLTLTGTAGTLRTDPPLCATAFTLRGDRFLRAWGQEALAESPIAEPWAVEAHTTAEAAEREADNEQNAGGDTGLGGSAPVEVTFTAEVTDAAIFTEWQMARDADFEVIADRYREREFTYTFTEMGTHYVRFVCDNAAGTCPWESAPYEVSISDSALLCPNAFSPLNSDGVNDEWKVSYRSIVSFDCHIYNRWGRELARLTDPSQGWDGRAGGKLVPPGVYFYAIKATGSDGKKYDLAGHINIVGQSAPLPGTGGGDADPEPQPAE